MRVLVAPDKFAGTLGAPAAAAAIARGWSRTAPDDELRQVPVADGGPGFVEALHAGLGGRLEVVVVRGPHGEDVPVTLLVTDDIVHVEAAQACGLAVTERRDPWTASSVGVGQAVAEAVRLAQGRPGAGRVVVGLGGSATNDGGAGLLAALGATADGPLDGGPAALRDVSSVDLTPAHELLAGVELVVAADVDVPLLGLFGATKTFGPQKGLAEDDLVAVDGVLDRFVDVVCGSTPAERRVADTPGAGAAGGLGFALLLLGGEIRRGVDLVADALGLAEHCAWADLVLTGEGRYDHTSRSGKAVFGVAERAAAAARPCVVLAGEVTVGSREMRAMGVESAHATVDLVGAAESLARPDEALADLAARVARSWRT